MPMNRLHKVLRAEVAAMDEKGTRKGLEDVITHVMPASGGAGPRYRLAAEGDKLFIKMNSNSYLGLCLHPDVREAEEKAVRRFGVGPGAVRFISGTYITHVDLEKRLAAFHGRESGMIFSSAYIATLGVLVPLTSPETLLVSDELNHNCIINAMRLSRPAAKKVYKHLDMDALKGILRDAAGHYRRVIVVTDGVFSMRGDHAPLDVISGICREFDGQFPENVVLVVDDSHGVGAFGASGRGTEEITGASDVDILVATLGKALGVNGGYVVGSRVLMDYLRETAPMYIYSNPITPAEAAAALRALEILDSPEGVALVESLQARTRRFRQGLVKAGYETLPGEHPVVPLMVRDTTRTKALVRHLKRRGVLATGLAYPVVPRGDEEIRFQINADHTDADIDEVLEILEAARTRT
ncbi:MAG: pyridoxal phosphate-dependent aminotransferase family protein [Acidobacteria bacterium]|nr:pyridoxal phosphate-dependent aminotransferase family protein [Acidobacteriota bacterium]